MDPALIASVPGPVLEIGRRLAERGHDAILVGGAVRDAFLRAASADWDLATGASPAEVRDIVSRVQGVRSVYDLGERFGTLGIVFDEYHRLEVSRYRPDALAAPSIPERFAADAAHRDFTANAIGVDLVSGDVLDPLGGRADLADRVLRAPGDPHERFAEDPLRVIRAARFVAELGFELEAGTRAALPAATPALERIAPERVRAELTRLLVATHAPEGLGVLHECGALAVVLPEVAALDGVTQPTFHDRDVLAHTFQAVGLAPAEPALRWATLLHDVGKAVTRSVEPDGRIRFSGHAQAGERIASGVVARLRFSAAQGNTIVHLVATHMRLSEIDLADPKSVDRAVRKLDLRAGDAGHLLASAEDAVALTLADFGATAHRHEAPALRATLEDAIAASRERRTHEPVASPVSGSDIMSTFGLAEGPEIGIAKGAVEDAIEQGRIASSDVEGAYAVAAAALQEARSRNVERWPDPPSDEDSDLTATAAYRLRRVFMGLVSLIVIVALLLLMILGIRRSVPQERRPPPPPPIRAADASGQDYVPAGVTGPKTLQGDQWFRTRGPLPLRHPAEAGKRP